MTVRAATGLDEAAMVAGWASALAARGRPPSKAGQSRVRAALREPLALGPVAVADGAVVGMLLAEPWRDGTGRPVAGVLHLAMLSVAPAAQRQGHGRALLEALLARYPRVRARCDEAAPLLLHCGFAPSGDELESPALQAERL